MKVYIVTRGSYSDYRIVGVYSNPKAAREYVKARDDHDWSEYEVDGLPSPPKGMKSYYVVMDRHGNVPMNGYLYPPRAHISLNRNDPEREWGTYNSSGTLFFAEMWARDEEHAVKIANERRTVALSNQATTE